MDHAVTAPARRATEFRSVLFRDGDDALQRTPPACFSDLNLDQIVEAVTRGAADDDLTAFFSTPLAEVDAIRYRQQVFRDLDDPDACAAVTGFADALERTRAQLGLARAMRDDWSRRFWLLAAQHAYQDGIARFAGYDQGLSSEALRGLRDYAAGYAASPEFRARVARRTAAEARLHDVQYLVHVDGLKVTVSRYRGEPDYGAEVAAAFEKFRQGEVADHLVKYADSVGLNHVEAHILQLVAGLFPDAFAALRECTSDDDGFLDPVISRCDREIRFYLAYRAHVRRLAAHGVAFCLPELSRSKDERVRGAVDLALADTLAAQGRAPVASDFDLTEPERLLVVTGANQGGKTTFARAFGQLHYLAALGCPVAAHSARLFLAESVFTHFPAQEDVGSLRSRLEDELVSLRETLRQATAEDIIILNEVFTSATLADATELGDAILRQLIDLDALGVCVTFIDELSRVGPTTVSMVARVDPEDPATRTFSVARQDADGLAHAAAIARRYGLTFDLLAERIRP